ncbi:unnamed protein product (macronuclear) [Paramecium tetraurelia]|uniref:Uncharacterized protein n=1 Tax=Paramecium tetraurelia TaxID=5888 RepID=A0CIU6_PARTE|nr:uncharacterized protein GSPATT00007848001 [Paramecium tetraurelia]CAK70713.1 unnamed protein product [Paramecium tetraurelia]|eukprot:XP_001438110.1 hypothetical protein (macronuclear) [Paramecium tetraurelia strain d4-2]
MKRSKLQSSDILDWYKKRFPQNVKPNYLYLPEEIKQQVRAQVIFENLDKKKESIVNQKVLIDKLAIDKLYDICVKSGMSINRNQVRMLFEKIDEDKSSIKVLLKQNGLIWRNFKNQFLIKKQENVAMKVRKNLDEGYLPIYYKSLISHLSFVSNREELIQQINDQSRNKIERFERIKEIMKLPYDDIENDNNLQVQQARRKLSELKQDYEGVQKVDAETQGFITSMNQRLEDTKKKGDDDSILLKKRMKRKSLPHNSSLMSLPKIDQNPIKWHKNLSLIDNQVRQKIFGEVQSKNNKINQLLSPRSKKHKDLAQLKIQQSKFIKKAKKQFDIQFDPTNENQQSIDYTGGRSFEEGILSLFQQQQQQGGLCNFTNISTIKNDKNDRDEILDQSGDHLPKSILRKIQQYKNVTRDSTQILLDKSILSSQQSKQSGKLTPIYYQRMIHQTHTNTDSLNSNDMPTHPKRRTYSQQDLKYQTPHFKQSEFQLPYL